MRLVMSAQPILVAPGGDDSFLAQYPHLANHPDAAVRAAIAAITTTASTDQVFSAVAPAPQASSGDFGASLEEASDLVGLTALRNNVEFAGITGSGYSVVIIDSGLDLDHPFFGADADGDGVADRIVYSEDFVTVGGTGADLFGHGTHVASILASQDATYTGVAPGVNIINLRVLNENGTGTPANIEKALKWVVAHVDEYNIAAVNFSLTLGDNLTAPNGRPNLGLTDELAAIAAQDVIIVGASGNSFFNFGSAPGVAYPSADPSAISVGAVFDADVGGPNEWSSGGIDYTSGPDRLTAFTQRHPTMTTILAPGAKITAAGLGGGTAVLSGTSMSAPFVAGMAVLAQQLNMLETGESLSKTEFADLLRTTGVHVFDGDDEDDNVINTQAEYLRMDALTLSYAILSGGLSELAIPGGVTLESSTVPAGGLARLGFTVVNQGLSNAPAFTTRYYLSTDNVIDATDTFLGMESYALDAGKSKSMSGHGVFMPGAAAPGSYFLGIVVDAANVVTEANENNNVVSIPITISGPAPEIWVVDEATGATLVDGAAAIEFGAVDQGAANIVKTFRIFNDGTTALSLGSLSLPAGFTATGFPASVAPLQSATFTITLNSSAALGEVGGNASFTNGDSDEDPFDFTVSGFITEPDDHGNDAATATHVDVASLTDGKLQPDGEVDWFSFDAVQGAEYTITTLLGTLSDSVLRLLDVDGLNSLEIDDDSGENLGSMITWTAPTDGVFYIEVRGKGTSGTYQVSIEANDDHGDDSASATPTTDPSTTHGRIESVGDVDFISFPANAGVFYRVQTSLATLESGVVRLLGVDGVTQIARSDGPPEDPISVQFVAPADGVYFIAVEARNPMHTGSYSVKLLGDDDHGDNAPNATEVGVGTNTNGTLETTTDSDWFVIDTIKGATYQFSTTLGSLLDSHLALFDADGTTLLAQNDDDGNSLASFIEWKAPTGGTYFLRVTGLDNSSGTYLLTTAVLDDVGNNADAAMKTGDPSTTPAVIQAAGDVDWFEFRAFAGVEYRIELAPDSLLGGRVRLLDVNETTELQTANGEPDQPAVITWTAPATGDYFLVVDATTPAAVGNYVLSIEGDDDHGDDLLNATKLTIPFGVDGVIERAGDVDMFAVEALPGLNYRVTVELGSLVGGAVRVLGPDGVTEVASANTADRPTLTVQWASTVAGAYYVEITEFPPASAAAVEEGELVGGTYRIEPRLLSIVPGDYDGDEDVDGNDFLVWQRSVGSSSTPTPVDSNGFEDYTLFALEGQHGWVQVGPEVGAATVIQSPIVLYGQKAVRVERGASADNRWAIPLGGTLPTGNAIQVSWDMRVTATGVQTGAIGPFFGVESYDDDGIFGLLGSFGVDATTLDVVYQQEDTGVFTETGRTVTSDVWYHFVLEFDFTNNEYSGYFEGERLFTVGFVDRGVTHDNLDQFTDADISALAINSGGLSANMTGTAYFDNFRVFDGIPRTDSAPDGNGDGIVNGLDLDVWKSNYGLSFSNPNAEPDSEGNAVPSVAAALESAGAVDATLPPPPTGSLAPAPNFTPLAQPNFTPLAQLFGGSHWASAAASTKLIRPARPDFGHAAQGRDLALEQADAHSSWQDKLQRKLGRTGAVAGDEGEPADDADAMFDELDAALADLFG